MKAVKTLQCPNLLHKFGKATVSAVSCLVHNWFKVLLLLLLCTTLPVVKVGLVLMVSMCQDHTYMLLLDQKSASVNNYCVITLLLMILYSRLVRNTRLGKWYLDKTSAVTQLAFNIFLKKKNNNEDEEEKKGVYHIWP